MLKKIIKLDGTEQDYQPSKLNRWSEWAAEHLGDLVDWSSIVMRAASVLPETVTSQQLQEQLIKTCLDQATWSYYLMAGKLYAVWLRKKFYGGNEMPSVQALHRRLQELGVMRHLSYSDEEYALVEKMIDHELDFSAPHFSLHHIRQKYSLKNRVTGEEYETQQFTYMRMAMAVCESKPREERMQHVKKFYYYLSNKKLSAPTPNFVNLGTKLKGYASCCLYAAGDNGISLAIGDYIANIMTQSSAGIGNNLMTRSLKDPVRNGLIKHQGKKPYYSAMAKAICANMQNGRGGAGTTYYSCFDPEANEISQLRNPRQVEENREMDIHYNMIGNKWFASKVAAKDEKDQMVLTFNCFTAPDLHKAFYSSDIKEFVRLYKEYEANPAFVKKYINARDLVVRVMQEGLETGTAYLSFIDEMNHHTPFKDVIYSSNLCAEICEPTKPYYDMLHLYSEHEVGHITFRDESGKEWTFPAHEKINTDKGLRSAIDLEVGFVASLGDYTVTVSEILHKTEQPEVAMCNLAAVAVDRVRTDEEYADVMYYAYLMIDYCIYESEYKLPHIGFTAKQRMNAGVGITGQATHMARRRLRYSSFEGKREIHFLAERHMWHAIGASLRISKERGLAPWMHKTKWPEGWLPIDTYNRSIDEIGKFEYRYDWESRRAEIIANGGIGHSCLVAHMPVEASSKALGGCNSLYPARELEMNKTDNGVVIRWAAPYGDDPGYMYEMAWDIPTHDMIDCYAITQKFTDQGISADLYRKVIKDEVVPSRELIGDYLHMVKRGLKTRYYFNSLTTDGVDLEGVQKAVMNNTGERGCASGACDV